MELDDKLKKMNDSYKKDKSAYEKLSKLKDALKKNAIELKNMQRTKEDSERKRDRAIEDKDKAAQANAEAAIKIADKEIERLKESISKSYDIIKTNKEKVDSYIKELSQDPEFKKQVNYILKQRYIRNAKKEMKKKEQVDKLIEICEKHPSIANNFKGMIKAEEELKKLDEELKKLDPKKDKKRIDEIEKIEIPTLASKKSKNEKCFKEFCEKNNIEFDEKLLNELINEKGYKHDKDGNIKLDKTLKNISRSYDKNVKAYERALNKIPSATKVTDTDKTKNEDTDKNIGDEENKEGAEVPATKFKWYQFRQRYNAWKERRKVKKEQKANEKEMGKVEKPSEKFRNAYRYDVVKDYVDQKEQEILRDSQKEVRKQKDDGKIER